MRAVLKGIGDVRQRIARRALSPLCVAMSGVAYAFPAGDSRAVLLTMAQVWQRLADQHEHSSTFLLFEPHAGERPVMQWQQIQPDDDKEYTIVSHRALPRQPPRARPGGRPADRPAIPTLAERL